ncbi:MAG: sugar ABC transporter permease [Lachnospiraceae bacterium]|nr:sugar ABC transporter permease [Lachnospiraceae bacterium]
MKSYRKFRCNYRSNGNPPRSDRTHRSKIYNGRLSQSRALFLLPSLTGVSVFVLFPFGDVAKRSFQTAMTKKFCGIANYTTIFHNQAFLLAVTNTARFVVVGIPLLLVLSLLLALMIDGSPFVQGWKSVYLFPMAIPTATMVLIWKLLFSGNGLLNGLLRKRGVPPTDWLGSDASFVVLVFSYLWKNMGYTIVLWMTGLRSVSVERKEAAKVDGASRLQCFLYVVLPELTPMVFTITVLSFLNSFKVFREAYLVAGAYPQQKMYLLQHLFNNWFTNLEMDKIAAAGVCIAAVFLIGVFALQRLWDRQE